MSGRAVGSTLALGRLKKRSEFLRVSQHGRKYVAPGFILLAAASDLCLAAPRIGFTVTRKMGNAVRRNRIRRRLREAAKQASASALAGMDYVLIAREQAYICVFEDLVRDMRRSFRKMAAAPKPEQRDAQ